MLYSTAKSFSFSTKAYSGGGRGSTTGVQRADLAHWSTSKKAPATYQESNRGGPIPIGLYIARYIGKYKRFGEVAVLEQTLTALLQRDLSSPLGFKVTNRDGFLIHGEGPRGSDGCIVPAGKEALKKVLAYIKSSNGGVLLEVYSEGVRSDRFEGRSSANVA